jgi:hypothetical protein
MPWTLLLPVLMRALDYRAYSSLPAANGGPIQPIGERTRRLPLALLRLVDSASSLHLEVQLACILTCFITFPSVPCLDYAMAVPNPQAHDLWKKAVDSLDPHLITGLDPAKTGVRDIVTAVFRVAQAKRDESAKKRWRISRRGKQDVIVRDVMEKIIFWIDRFKDVGDNAVQYDPGHAALPWAAIRFILQAAVNYTEVEREILEGIELVTRLLASFREVEKIYLRAGVLVELQDALVSAYATILETLSEAVKYLSQSKKIHGLKAPFKLAGGENIKRLLDSEHQVIRFTSLVNGQRLLDVSTKVSRTAELSAITDKAVEGQKYQAILRWLSATRYLEHHGEQRKLRTPGTGTWLLRHAE